MSRIPNWLLSMLLGKNVECRFSTISCSDFTNFLNPFFEEGGKSQTSFLYLSQNDDVKLLSFVDFLSMCKIRFHDFFFFLHFFTFWSNSTWPTKLEEGRRSKTSFQYLSKNDDVNGLLSRYTF